MRPQNLAAQEGPSFYTANASSTTVTPIDTGTNTAGTPIVAGVNPGGVGVTPDQSFIYVANFGSSSVSVINTGTNATVATIVVGNNPVLSTLSLDGSRLYVGNTGSNSVSVINTATNTVVATVAVGANPYGVQLSLDQSRLYVSNRGTDTLSVINTATNVVTGTIAGFSGPLSLALTRDGRLLYVGNQNSNSISIVDTSTNTVMTTFATTAVIPTQVVLSLDGTRLYVTGQNSNTVSVIDTATNAAVTSIAVGTQPVGAGLSPDGRFLYVENRLSNNVSVIDVGTNTVIATVPVGAAPAFGGICANGNALLTSGRTFVARTGGSLGCTGAAGAVFTGGTLQIAGAGVVSAVPIALAAAGGTVDTNGNAATLSGAITGPGGLTKTGAGVLTLSGQGSYSGPTAVNVGTLAAGAANVFSTSSAYTVATGATLNLASFNQAIGSLAGSGAVTLGTGTLTTGADNSSTTFSGAITGTGGLTKIGTGGFTVSGVNTYTGGTSVNAGILNVTGSATSAATVNNGGTIAGSGSIGGLSVQNGGVAYPGAVTSAPTRLNVAGNVAFAAGSTFRVSLTPAAADRITATGTATIAGGTVDVLAGSGSYTATTRYTLLSAAGGLTGRFTNLTTTTNLAFLSPTLSYDANDVFLGFAPATTFTSVAVTPNQVATANGLQSLPTSNALYTAVLNQTIAGARQAFDALSGEVHSSEISAQFETAFMVREALLDRLRGFGSGNAGFGLAGATVPASFAADLPGGRKPEIAAVPFTVLDPRVFALWGQGFGSFGWTRTNGNAATLTRDTGGFVIGGDATLDGTYRIGIAGGFTDTNIDVRARGSRGEVTSGFGALYGGANFGTIQLRLGGAFAGNSTDTTRNVSFPGFSQSLSAKFGGTTFQGFSEVGYRFGFGTAAIEPFVGGAGIRISRDRFTETGGVAALTVAGRDYDTQTFTVGVRGEMALTEGSPFSVKGLVGYRRAFGDITPVSLLAFAAGGSQFSTAGVPIDRDAVIAEIGVDWRVTNDVTLGLSYAGQAGSRAQDNGVKGSMLYRF